MPLSVYCKRTFPVFGAGVNLWNEIPSDLHQHSRSSGSVSRLFFCFVIHTNLTLPWC